ncbi:hypothetical protein LCGC14_1742890 [marine sediment metagenome]|uniref:Carbon storage regulator n=1 Tax=marine sediment metagenome TaxID=412755 RepID=A0A0F9K5S6_9ZZZZ
MLVLSRKVGQQIVMADGLITLTVVKVRGNTVRLGIAAPDDVSVDRHEVYLSKARERTAPKPGG